MPGGVGTVVDNAHLAGSRCVKNNLFVYKDDLYNLGMVHTTLSDGLWQVSHELKLAFLTNTRRYGDWADYRSRAIKRVKVMLGLELENGVVDDEAGVLGARDELIRLA